MIVSISSQSVQQTGPIVDDSRIKGNKSVAERAIRKPHVPVKFIFPVRRITYGNADGTVITAYPLIAAQAIIQIISPVISAHAVGRIKVGSPSGDS